MLTLSFFVLEPGWLVWPYDAVSNIDNHYLAPQNSELPSLTIVNILSAILALRLIRSTKHFT
jgi:hypothetical protein